MTLEQVYYISQIAAAGLILISLVAVYWQVRQTKRLAKADFTFNVWLQAGQMQMSLFDTPEKAEQMSRALRGAGPLTDPEKLRVEAALSIPLGLCESAFTLRQRGLIEAESYNSFEAVTRRYMRSPVVQQWWARNRRGKDAAYVALIDGMIVKIQSQQVAAVKPEDTAQ